MAKELKFNISNEINTNFIRRYPPEGIFADGTGFSKQPTIRQLDKNLYQEHDTITDQESYRLSMASSRGAISALTPEQQKGFYMFPDGKYDPHADISYILRKDLSVVEIEEYISRFKENLESATEDVKQDVESQIAQLEAKKLELISKEKSSSKSDTGKSE